jgi:N-acetylglutamate synthase
MVEHDLPAARELWAISDGVELAEGDDPPELSRYLQRNPGMSQVALMEHRLVGAVLAGHDGRRGFLYHLAVHPSARCSGIGRELVQRCLQALKQEGITRARSRRH